MSLLVGLYQCNVLILLRKAENDKAEILKGRKGLTSDRKVYKNSLDQKYDGKNGCGWTLYRAALA